MKEIYVSTDVESDGPIPGPNSMLSFASAAILPSGVVISIFEANLETLEGASSDPDTAAWWAKPEQAKAWEACRKDLQSPQLAMWNYVHWVGTLKAKGYSPVFVAYPAGYDFLFMYWYMVKFTGSSPFSFSAIDMKTYAMAVLKKPYRECTKKAFPARWFPKNLPHTHVALDDALEQGQIFINMLKENS